MRRLSTFLILLSMAGACWSFQKGDWVLGQWRGGAFWFPAVVEAHQGKTVTMLYDDGTRESRPENQVKAYDWRVGSRVECDWKGGGKWYGGRITRLDGANLSIAYDDGDKEDTQTGRCRSR